MPTKSDRTKQFILQKVAPVFNKNGYFGTSMSDITEATGLTKGAIYGNFKNKEDLAYYSFYFNVSYVMTKLGAIIENHNTSIDQLLAISDFYKNDYLTNIDIGGCPIVNLGVDANHTNPKLYKAVKQVIIKIQGYIHDILIEGIKREEIKKEVNAKEFSSVMFSLIEGGIFTSMTMNDNTYLRNMMNHLDSVIRKEIKN
ncbi:MAG: TetR/AcrR family transcriptional regulator [Flavobacteriales bacterium]